MSSKEDITKFIEGFEEKAYRRGFDAAVEQITKFMEGLRRKPPYSLNQATLFFDSSTKGKSPFRPGSDMAAMYEYMKKNQGLRGIEIINGMAKSGRPIALKTARTGLHRMKVKGQALNQGGRWYIP